MSTNNNTEIVVAEHPKTSLLKLSTTMVEQLTCQQVEQAIQHELAASELHRRADAVSHLRCGVLFHIYKQQSGAKDFWNQCQRVFGVSPNSVSRKMRLVNHWVKEVNAGELEVLALAQAADLCDTNNPGVAKALEFTGEDSVTDLYRKHKIIQPPVPQHHPRKELKPGEAEENRIKTAKVQVQDWLRATHTLIKDVRVLADAGRLLRKEAVAAGQELNRVIKKIK